MNSLAFLPGSFAVEVVRQKALFDKAATANPIKQSKSKAPEMFERDGGGGGTQKQPGGCETVEAALGHAKCTLHKFVLQQIGNKPEKSYSFFLSLQRSRVGVLKGNFD